MQDQQENHPTVSPVAREKCIERARDAVRYWEKWGRYQAVLYLIKGFGLLLVGVLVIVLISGTECPARFGPGAQKPFEEGFVGGVALGMFLLVVLFVGGIYVVKGIKALRCDPTDCILLEYHDALVNLIHNQELCQLPASDSPASEESFFRN